MAVKNVMALLLQRFGRHMNAIERSKLRSFRRLLKSDSLSLNLYSHGSGHTYEHKLLLIPLISPASRRHARLQSGSGAALGLHVGSVKPAVAVLG